MMAVPILGRETRWSCPNCTTEDVTTESRPHTRFHICKGMLGLTAPMVVAGTSCKIERRDREDYVRGEQVTKDANGRPVMSIVVTRDDGQDCVVFAPTALARAMA